MGQDIRLDGVLAMPSGEPISRNRLAAEPQLHYLEMNDLISLHKQSIAIL